MAEATAKKQRGGAAAYVTTPFFLLLLAAGITVLCYVLMPTHYIEKYLNLAFMDDLKTTSATAGLNVEDTDIPMDSSGETYARGSIIYPHFGEQYAILSAPAIELQVGVYYGSSTELLQRGVCQSTQSSYLGDGGNTVIDGHVNTFFSDLTKLAVGDEIVMYTKYGIFTYAVTELIEFEKTDKTYVAVTDEEYLTVYTCQPQVLGTSDLRVGVRCEPTDKNYFYPITD